MTEAGPLDVLSELPVDGGHRSFAELETRHVDAEIGSIVVHVASLGDIVASKEHAGRAKDLDALPELRRLLNQPPDTSNS